MLFNSPEYIFVFLPLVVFLYFGLNKLGHIQIAKVWLVCASLFFYGYWNSAYIPLLIGSILVNFGAGNLLYKAKLDSWNWPISGRAILIVGISLNSSPLISSVKKLIIIKLAPPVSN